MEDPIGVFSEVYEIVLRDLRPDGSLKFECHDPAESAYIEYDSNGLMCRFTFWAEGSYFHEGLRIASGEQVFCVHGEAKVASEMRAALVDFIRCVDGGER